LGDQGRQHNARLPFAVTSYGASPTTIKLAAKDGFADQREASLGHALRRNLFRDMDAYPIQQFRGVKQSTHIVDLVDAHFQEETAELHERLLGERSAPIIVVCSTLIRSLKQPLIVAYVARESPRHGPERTADAHS